jgi:acyl-CoA synthetase (AMP-forming)/AMP-acid ligase II
LTPFHVTNRLEQEVPYASLPALVDGAAERFGDATLWASIDDSTRISFRHFAQLTLKCAQALNALGVGPGTHVAVMLPNVPAYVITWLALARIGAVMVPVNTQYKPRELEYVLKDSATSFLVIDQSCLPVYEAMANRVALVPRSQLMVHGTSDSKLNWQRLVEAAPATALNAPQPTAESLMSIQFTSGSTGFPKGCMLTQDYWLVLGWVRSHQGPVPKRVLIDKPLSYMGGKWRFLICLFMGSTAYVALRFSLTGLQQRLVDHNIDFFSVTDAVAKLPELPAVAKLDIAWISSGGLSKGLHQALEEKFHAPVRELYGMTETGSTIYMPIEATAMVASGSCGLPAPYRECRIVGPDGDDVAPGTVGELWVKGRGILKAYFNKADATRNAFAGEWFRTGDLFRQDANGYFYIEGRIKDSIRRSGENISAREVEADASGISGVLETAAVGVPDEKRGEEVKLYLVLQPGFSRDQVPPAEVIAYCEDKLAAFKLPRYIEYVADFPRTSSGKIAKHQLEEIAKARPRAIFDRSINAWQP